jgi:hypothetical protein
LADGTDLMLGLAQRRLVGCLWAGVAGLAACRPAPPPDVEARRSASESRAPTPVVPSFDTVSAIARTISNQSVVVFWLHEADTIPDDERRASIDDLRDYTQAVAPLLAAHQIDLVATRSDTVFVEAQGGKHRLVMLSGLDYPYGYVFIDPGYPEEIVTGVLTDDNLESWVRDYFELPDPDSTTTVATR